MRIVLYTNILSPYRRSFFDALYKACKEKNIDFTVLIMARTESNRSWNYEDYATEYTQLLEFKTFHIRNAYIHYNKNLQKALKQLAPDIVICGGSYFCPGVWKVSSLKKRYGYKVFYWSESHLNEKRSYHSLTYKIREAIRNKFYKRFDGFWYAGKLSREFIEAYCNRDAKMMFTPNLVEEDKFGKACQVDQLFKRKIKEKYNIPLDKRIIITPARLDPEKGIIDYINILSGSKCVDKIHWMIVGNGSQREEIQDTINQKHLPISLLGYRNQEEMIELYSISDIFLLPSLSDPNPLSCIEALWAGLPLLVSEHVGNHVEVVDLGKNGEVFSYLDEKKAGEKLEKMILADEKWILEAEKWSRHKAEQNYGTYNNAKRILDELCD